MQTSFVTVNITPKAVVVAGRHDAADPDDFHTYVTIHDADNGTVALHMKMQDVRRLCSLLGDAIKQAVPEQADPPIGVGCASGREGFVPRRVLPLRGDAR